MILENKLANQVIKTVYEYRQDVKQAETVQDTQQENLGGKKINIENNYRVQVRQAIVWKITIMQAFLLFA